MISIGDNLIIPGRGCGSAVTTDPLSAGLLAWWKFDEYTGSVAIDSSGNGANGTYVNSPDLTNTGIRDYCVTLNGSSQYVRRAGAWNFTSQPFTFSIWINPTVLHDSDRLINKGVFDQSGYMVRFYAAGFVQLATSQAGASQGSNSDSLLTTGSWQHVAIVRSGSTVSFWINGASATAYHGTHIDPVSNEEDFVLGVYPPGPTNFYSGGIDDFRVYNKALTGSDISSLYGGGISYPPPG